MRVIVKEFVGSSSFVFFEKSHDKYEFLLRESVKFTELAEILEQGQYNTIKGTAAIGTKLKSISYEFLEESYKEHFDEQVLVSLMCQYVPFGQAEKFPKINRKITKREYEKVKNVLFDYELDGFTQDLASADTSYIPSWDF